VTPQRIPHHAATHSRTARKSRSLALRCGPLCRCQACSDLPFLLLLRVLAILLSQLVVIDFCEGGHGPRAFLGLGLGCGVLGTEEAGEVLGGGAGPGLTGVGLGGGASDGGLVAVGEFSLLDGVLEFLAGAVGGVVLVWTGNTPTHRHGRILLIRLMQDLRTRYPLRFGQRVVR
jgi:hypothetical protein